MPHHQWTASERAKFLHQFAALLDSGLSVQQSLSLAGKNLHPARQNYLQKASAAVATGQDLASVLALPPSYFDGWTIALIQIADYSGALPEACRRLAIASERQQRREQLYRSVKLATIAMIWSLLLLLLAILQGNATVLTQPGFWMLAIGLLIVLLAASNLSGFPPITQALQQLLQGVPLLGKIGQARSMLDFAALELPLSCGISLLTSLELLHKHIPDRIMAGKLAIASERVSAGQPLSRSLQGRLPAVALQMIRTGEETGNLNDALKRLSGYYEAELERLLQQLKSILLPLSIMAVGGLIALLGIGGMTSVINILPR